MLTSVFTNLSLIPDFLECINEPDNLKTNILNLNVKKSSSKNDYKVIRYNKDILSVDLIPTYGLFRSVVLNSNNKVVCFSPPKSMPSDTFISSYPIKTENIIAQEFVEGTMINVFWDDTIGISGGWEISTRNSVGATSKFYKNSTKTFRDMFLEASNANNLILDNLNKEYCYSFVLQHPENRIVVPFNQPQLYLVAMYKIVYQDTNVLVFMLNMTEVKQFDWSTTSIKFPQIYEWDTYSDVIEKYGSMNTNYDVVGVVLFNNLTGERAKVRNPVYEQVRHLRGNQPKLQYQYLSLRKEGNVGDFLKFYPENKKDFSAFRDQLHLFTNTLYSNYVSCYMKKEKPLMEYSQQYRTHMFSIHQKFMNELRVKKQFITNTIVIQYVNNLHPSLLMYCLNFQMRKRNVDYVKSESE